MLAAGSAAAAAADGSCRPWMPFARAADRGTPSLGGLLGTLLRRSRPLGRHDPGLARVEHIAAAYRTPRDIRCRWGRPVAALLPPDDADGLGALAGLFRCLATFPMQAAAPATPGADGTQAAAESPAAWAMEARALSRAATLLGASGAHSAACARLWWPPPAEAAAVAAASRIWGLI